MMLSFFYIDGEATSIPARCCAFPYMLNNEVHYNCSINAAINNDLGCFHGDGQSQWVKCQQPYGTFLKFQPAFLPSR